MNNCLPRAKPRGAKPRGARGVLLTNIDIFEYKKQDFRHTDMPLAACTLQLAPCSMHLAACPLQPAPCSLLPAPCHSLIIMPTRKIHAVRLPGNNHLNGMIRGFRFG